MTCFPFQEQKEFKKPKLEYPGQNQANVENWRRHQDQGLSLGRILKKIHGKCQFLKILVSFNGFGPFWKKENKKEEL